MIARRTLLTAPALLPAAARAQDSWPGSRPIRVIVPFPPGAANDSMGRLLAARLAERLGATTVVENRPGGSAVIGTAAVHQAAPDGHTLLASAFNHIMLNHVLRAVPFDPIAEFEPVARTARAPLVLVMHPGRPQRTVAEVVAAARAAPRDWTLAVAALGAAGHLASIALNRDTGAGLEMASYRGTMPALTDVVAGNAQLLIDASFALLPAARDGRVRALGIATDARSPLAPDIPTLIEAGLPGFTFSSWYGVWSPRGTPMAIRERINALMRETMAEPEVVARLAGWGLEPITETIPAMQASIARDLDRSLALLRSVGFRPE